MNNMELILFDRYLVRSDEINFFLSKVKDGKEPLITIKENGKKDYSNFGKEVYPSSFSQCLSRIKEWEIKDSPHVTTLDELVELLNKIDNRIRKIERKFK